MKTPVRHSGARAGRGFALVVVLTVILMLTVLVVGLLVMAENETRSAARYMDAADARLAADSVLEIVQGQIREATISGIEGTGEGTHAWASQPGAIRVFDDEGGLVNIFKLYSSDMMVTGTANFSGDTPGSSWNPDEFVDLNAPVFRNNQWIYPIASPEALGEVAGFSSSRAQSSVTWDDRLAMPVRWLYLQKNGTMNADPSVGEPVLRVAYWTDDESSKININTASATDANSYADIPRANFRDERGKISLIQPAQNEFNRYPGHPATVSLTTVFPASTISDLIHATPRYEWGGSENATRSINVSRTALPGEKRNRLYSGPDEFLFGTNRAAQLSLDAPQVDARRFFLTTTSRSSDLNLFGQPRVTIWPVYAADGNDDPRRANSLRRTPYDQLIAHASTIGAVGNPAAKRYLFVRRYPLSQELDWTSFPRNRSLFSYLRAMTSDGRPIPGFGGSFEEKYNFSRERDQILTEIFDSIRCTNLNETYQGQSANFEPYTKKLDYSGGSSGNHKVSKDYAGSGYVLPIKISDYQTRGAGRVPVLSEVGIWLIQTYADEVTDGGGNVTEPSKPFDPPRVQVGLLLETFSPMQGPMTWMPLNFSIRLRNITPPRIGTRNLFEDDQTESYSAGPIQTYADGQGFGGPDGWAWTFASHDRSQTDSFPHSLGRNPPWAMAKSNAIELSPGATEIEIIGGEIEIEFLCEPNGGVHLTPAQKAGTPFQTYRIAIPSVTVPVPNPVPFTTTATGPALAAARNGWYERGMPPRFFPEDVVRSVEWRDGDARIAAYCQEVPSGFFEKHPDYNTSGAHFAHGFRLTSGINSAFLGTTNGGYVNLTYGEGSSTAPQQHFRTLHGPDISSRITSLTAQGWEGDFDTGIGSLPDGPYLGKSDEGGLAHNSSDSIPPYFYHIWYRGVGLFSPLKQSPSAVVFGSLPTGVKQTVAAYTSGQFADARPWRTLNFCPNPLAGASHYGLTEPADSLMLDLFTMPIVEPYAISEPFSTAGRLNMNYQIVPFTYIQRKTAMVAALSAQQVGAIRNEFADNYKDPRLAGAVAAFPDRSIRFPVNVNETLRQFDTRFDGQDIFRSASEICGLYLVPQGATAADVATWWDDYRLTGNNLRERPYASLYPLLTTKSNVYTTHIRAQAIKRTPDGRIQVNGEYRGSVTFERYLDPNDPKFTNGTVNPDEVSLEPYFRFRTLTTKQFDL